MNKRKQQDGTLFMNHILCNQVIQRWHVVQQELIPDALEQTGCLTLKLEQMIHVPE